MGPPTEVARYLGREHIHRVADRWIDRQGEYPTVLGLPPPPPKPKRRNAGSSTPDMWIVATP
eukprot:7489227-Pyramimonas_sp.AAC.1